jgi:hypothetical protein
MTILELIDLLEEYPGDTQVFVHTTDLHTPEVAEYSMDDIPSILVIS